MSSRVNVLRTCHIISTALVTKAVAVWRPRPQPKPYLTVFIDRLTGGYLGPSRNYVDNEDPQKITFPDLVFTLKEKNEEKTYYGINVRSVYNGKTTRRRDAKPKDYSTEDYPIDFDGNLNGKTVSKSFVFLEEEYISAFRDIIKTQEAGEQRELAAAITADMQNSTLTAVQLPYVINLIGVGEWAATADSLPAILMQWGFATYLLPNGPIENYKEYFENYSVVLEILELMPEKLGKKRDLWSLACKVYVLRNRTKYTSNPNKFETTQKYDGELSAIIESLKDISFDYKHPSVSVSHTHPYFPAKDALPPTGTTTIYKRTSVSIYSAISGADKVYGDNTKLPDLVITFKGDGFINAGKDEDGKTIHKYRQKVEKFEVVYPGAKVVKKDEHGHAEYEATLVAKSVAEFEKNAEEILFVNLLSKYFPNG